MMFKKEKGMPVYIKNMLTVLMFIGVFITFVKPTAISAESLPEPTKEFYVLDEANILSDVVEKELISIAEEVESIPESPQMVLVTTDDLKGLTIEEYATELVSKWGIGNADLDNGVLLIYNKKSDNYRIEVGYGLEGAINDGTAGAILDSAIAVKEKEGIEKGLVNAFETISLEIKEEYDVISSEELESEKLITYTSPDETEGSTSSNWVMVLVLVHFIHLLVAYIFYKVTGFKAWFNLVYSITELLLNIAFIFARSSGGSSSSKGGRSGGGGSSGGGGASR